MKSHSRFALRLLSAEVIAVVCLCIALSASAQQPAIFEAELAPPAYQPQVAIYSAARLIRNGIEEGFDAEFIPRSDACLGGRVKVAAIQQ